MSWSKQIEIPKHPAAYSIGMAAISDDRLVCVHRSARNDTKLRWVVINVDATGKVSYSDDQVFTDHHSANGASLAMFNGKLYCVHRGGDRDDWLYYTVYDADKNVWGNDTQLQGARSNENPAIAPFTDAKGTERLFCVYRGCEQDDRLFYTWNNGHDWELSKPLSEDGHHCWGTPSLALHKGVLYCVHRGRLGDDSLWCTTYHTFEGSWTADKKLPGHTTSNSVALASDGKKLNCVHRGRGDGTVDDINIWWTHFDGETWSKDEKTGGQGRWVSLAFVKAARKLLCVSHYGILPGDNNLYYMTGDPHHSP